MRIAEVYTSGTANQQANAIADAFVKEVIAVDPDAVVHVSVSGDNRKLTFAGVIETTSQATLYTGALAEKAVNTLIADSALIELDVQAVMMCDVQHVPLRSFYTKGYATKHTDSMLPIEMELVTTIKNALEVKFVDISAGIGLMYDEQDRQIKGVTVSVYDSVDVESVKSFLVEFVASLPYQKGQTQIIITPTAEGGIQHGTFGRSGMNPAQEFYGQEEAHVTISLAGCSESSFEKKASVLAHQKARHIITTHHEKPDEVQVELTYIQGVPYPIAGYVYITVGSNENRHDLSEFN